MQQSQTVQAYVNEEPVHRFKHLLWRAASHTPRWKLARQWRSLGTHSLIRQHSSGASRGSPGWCKLPEPRRLLWWACHAVYIAGLALVGWHVGHMHLLLTLQSAVNFSCPQLSCLRLAGVLLKQSTNQRSHDEGVNAVRKPAKMVCSRHTMQEGSPMKGCTNATLCV